MSNYFDVFFACDLKRDTPPQVIDILLYLTEASIQKPTNLPKHPFFEMGSPERNDEDTTEEWAYFLAPSEMPYAPGSDHKAIAKQTVRLGNGDTWDYYTFSFRKTMHDDVEFYIQWWDFLAWIAPYVETTGYIGYIREVDALAPALIFYKEGKFYTYKVKASPDELYRHEHDW